MYGKIFNKCTNKKKKHENDLVGQLLRLLLNLAHARLY